VVYSIWSWTNVPEVALFQQGFRSYLWAAATPVELPPGFWQEPLVIRQALFFREVVRRYLPVQILEGELIVGSHFNTALSRCLKKTRPARVVKSARSSNLARTQRRGRGGAQPCRASCAELSQGLEDRMAGHPGRGASRRNRSNSTVEQRNLACAIVICADAVRDLMERYAAEAQASGDSELIRFAHPSCARSPASAARCRGFPGDVPEALQALWFTHMLAMAAESYPGRASRRAN
jgi:hypothetical protein